MSGCAQLHIKIMREFIINCVPFNHQGAEVTFRNLAHIHNYSLLQWCSAMVGRIHLCQNEVKRSQYSPAVDSKWLLYSIINSTVQGVQWSFAPISECYSVSQTNEAVPLNYRNQKSTLQYSGVLFPSVLK